MFSYLFTLCADFALFHVEIHESTAHCALLNGSTVVRYTLTFFVLSHSLICFFFRKLFSWIFRTFLWMKITCKIIRHTHNKLATNCYGFRFQLSLCSAFRSIYIFFLYLYSQWHFREIFEWELYGEKNTYESNWLWIGLNFARFQFG